MLLSGAFVLKEAIDLCKWAYYATVQFASGIVRGRPQVIDGFGARRNPRS